MKKQFLILLLLLSAFFAQSFAQTLQDSLILHLPMRGGSGDDVSGNNNHTTIYGAIPTADRHGVANSALWFDGVDDYLEFPTNPQLKPQFPMSMTCWIRMDGAPLNNFFTNDFQNNTYSGVWVNVGDGGKIGATYGDGGPCGPQSRKSRGGTTVLQTGVWYHIAVVWFNANTVDICLNGMDDGGAYSGTGGPLAYTSGSGRIGCKDALTTSPPNFFHGAIDDVRFYNRALGKEEIRDIHAQELLGLEPVEEIEMEVFPNPVVNGKVTFRGDAAWKDVKCQLISVEGKILKEYELHSWSGEQTLDLSEVTCGICFLAVETEEGRAVKKLILK